MKITYKPLYSGHLGTPQVSAIGRFDCSTYFCKDHLQIACYFMIRCKYGDTGYGKQKCFTCEIFIRFELYCLIDEKETQCLEYCQEETFLGSRRFQWLPGQLNIQKQPSEVFCKKGVSQEKFTRKHLCRSFFINKVGS